MAKRRDSKGRVLQKGEYQRKTGTYQYKTTDRLTGEKIQASAETLEELREKEATIMRDMMDGLRAEAGTLDELFAIWERTKRGLKDNTKSNYIYTYRRFIAPALGKKKIKDIRKSDVKQFYADLLTQGLQVNSIDSVHTVLHQVLEIGVDDDLIRLNPSSGAMTEIKREHEPKRKKALSPEEQAVLIQYLKEYERKSWYPIFYTMLKTGMRVGEATGLTWEDIKTDEGVIEVNRTLVYYSNEASKKGREMTFAINTPKSESGRRRIPIDADTIEAIEIQRQYGHRCEMMVDGVGDFVFVNRFGNVQHQGSLNKVLRRIIRDCNEGQLASGGPLLPRFSCHTLRHTAATNLVMSGVNLKAVQEILGHADFSTTMDIYAEATAEVKAHGVEQMNDYISGFIEKFEKENEKKDLASSRGGETDESNDGDFPHTDAE